MSPAVFPIRVGFFRNQIAALRKIDRVRGWEHAALESGLAVFVITWAALFSAIYEAYHLKSAFDV